MSHFDLVVLGAGPGGYVAAIRAAQLGKSVAVVEKQYWGGVCLNVGLHPVQGAAPQRRAVAHPQHEKDLFGITGDASMDFGPTHARSREVSDSIVKGVHFLMKKNKITEIDGWGTLQGRQDARASTLEDGGTDEVTCDNLIIATGATTRLVPGTSLSDNVVTYEEQILDDELPGSIVIAGSGAIGVEFAYVMTNFGVDVTIVEFLDRMVPTEDAEVSKELLKHYKKLGVKSCSRPRSRRSRTPATRSRSPSPRTARRRSSRPTRCSRRSASRRALEGYGLEKTGVETTDRGAIAVDARGRTNVDGVYAIGDVTGKLMLAHTAETMGIVAAETIAGARDHRDRLRHDPAGDVLPAADRLLRLLRGAGQGEGLRRQGGQVPVLRQRQGQGPRRHESASSRSSPTRSTTRSSAPHLIGPDVTELLPALTLAQKWDLTADEVARNIFAHPTLVRGGQGSHRGHRRPHDPPVTGWRRPGRASALSQA